MMMIFVGLVFSGAIPMLLPLCFIGLFTRFVFFKYSFIRFSRVPKTYDESLDHRMSQVMAISLIAHLAFSIWTYGVPEHFAFEPNWLSELVKIALI